MARNPKADNARSALLTERLTPMGWDKDFYRARTVEFFKDRYRKVSVVADGRPCDRHRKVGVCEADDPIAKGCDRCFTDRGRGTTLIDLSRKVESGSLVRADFLSVKTGKIARDGKLPSRVDVSTGNPETVEGIVDAAMRSAIPVFFWASENGSDGEPSKNGMALFLDVGRLIRAHGVAPLCPEGYSRGKAPPCYVGISSRRITGASKADVAAFENHGIPLPPGKWSQRAENFAPGFDTKGRYWSRPYAVHYSELRVSLSACGIGRDDWTYLSLGEVGSFVESQDWNQISL